MSDFTGWRTGEEDHHADQENPSGKHQLGPLVFTGCHNQHQCDEISEDQHTHRGKAEVRRPAVVTERVNTAAMRMA